MTLSSNATNADIISEINRLSRKITALETGKRNGRNVTGTRAVPTSATQLIQGDIRGDYLYNGINYYELELVDGVALKWAKYTIDSSF